MAGKDVGVGSRSYRGNGRSLGGETSVYEFFWALTTPPSVRPKTKDSFAMKLKCMQGFGYLGNNKDFWDRERLVEFHRWRSS
jgi:hypothetical protein